jgi:predicted esterase
MTRITPSEIPLDNHLIPAVNKGMTNGNKLMLVLHGRGDTLDSYKTLTREINVTGLNYLLLNAPFTEFFGYTWYDDSFSFDQRYLRSMDLLEETFSYCENRGFKSEDIFLFGFSQGGRMVLDLFLRLQKRLAGVVAFSPRMTNHKSFPELSNQFNETPLLLSHGLQDEVIPFSETQEISKSWQKSFKNTTFKSYEMGHEMDISQIQYLREWLNEYL